MTMTALSLIVVVLTTLAIMNEGSPICKDPPYISNKNYNINPQDVTHVDIPSAWNKTKRFLVAGKATCNPDGYKYDTQPYCPVHYVLNYDINRIPQSKYEQICSCSNPSTSDGVYLVECKPVFKNAVVQRIIGCGDDGFYNYTLTLEAFQTGCESILPSIRYVPSDTPKSPA